MEFIPGPAVLRVLCADCGTPIQPNSANLCIACLRNSIDITEGIPKQASVAFCRNCERFLSPPTTWMLVKTESSELLSICLRKLKGLNKVRLIEAHFIWTEPHSKRLRVSMTIQKEVLINTILEQTFEIEYLVQHGQCSDCSRLAAKNTWKALVQVRQKVPHKRTFLYLEQLILKHNAQKDTISIKEVRDGLDFFYSQRSHAIKMVEFLSSVVPVRSKSSEQLLSSDTHSNTANFKYTYSVEIAPVCKDDLICVPPKQARSFSNISPLTLCTRVGSSIQLLDSLTLQNVEVNASVYWRAPFESLASVTDLVEFTVLDVELDHSRAHHHQQHGSGGGQQQGGRSRFALADAQVALSSAFKSKSISSAHHHQNSSSMDYDDSLDSQQQIFHTRTHLGGILQPGDTVLGYFLTSANFNSDHFAALPQSRVPDLILVRKTYPNRRKKNKQRKWRLKSIVKDEIGTEGAETGDDHTAAAAKAKGVVGRMGGRDQKKVEEDYELFLRDLEEDPEMRKEVNLYKADVGDVKMRGVNAGLVPASAKGGGKKKRGGGAQHAMDVDMDADAAAPRVEQPSKEDSMGVDGKEDRDGDEQEKEEEDGEEEPDFPEVRLDELLNDFDEMTLGAERGGDGDEVGA